MATKKTELDKNQLTHAVRVAADTFKRDMKMFEQLAEAGGNGLITAEAARQTADLFLTYSLSAEALLENLEDFDRVVGEEDTEWHS